MTSGRVDSPRPSRRPLPHSATKPSDGKPVHQIRLLPELPVPKKHRTRRRRESLPMPPLRSTSLDGESWREVSREAAETLKLMRETDGMLDKVERLAAKLQKKGCVREDGSKSDFRAGFPAYQPEPPARKKLVTWNDARNAPQQLSNHVGRHVRAKMAIPREVGNKHFDGIKPSPDAGFFTSRIFSRVIIPAWAGGRYGNAALGSEASAGGLPKTDAAIVPVPLGGIASLGSAVDGFDQFNAYCDMKSDAKKAAIGIVTNFRALLIVLRHEAGEAFAATPQDEDYVAARSCLVALQKHPKFSKEIAEVTRRCQLATVRDSAIGLPVTGLSVTRLGVSTAASLEAIGHTRDALATTSDVLGGAVSGAAGPISGLFDVRHGKLEHKLWARKRREAKAMMAWLEPIKHLPVSDDMSPASRADRHLFNALLPACWQAQHDAADHALFMKRCSYVRFFKGFLNTTVVWPLWVSLMATGTVALSIAAGPIGACVGSAYLISMGAKLGKNARRKSDQKNDQQAADIAMATRRTEGLAQTIQDGSFEVTTPRGAFVNGQKVFAGQKTHQVDVQLNPAVGLACFATLIDKMVRDKPLDPQVREQLLQFMARRKVGELEFSMIKKSVLAAARLRKAADPTLDDEGDEWARLEDLQAQLSACFGVPRGAPKLSEGVFLESFFGAALAQRAQSHAQQHPERQAMIADCLSGAGRLLSEPAQGLELLNRVARNLSAAAPGFHYSHCSDPEMQGIADKLFPGIPPKLFLEKSEHLLAMAAAARRKGDHFDWQVDGLPMGKLGRFCKFVRQRWNRDVNAVRRVERSLALADDKARKDEILGSFDRSQLESALTGVATMLDDDENALSADESKALQALRSRVRRYLDKRYAISADGSADSYVRRMAQSTSDRYPLAWSHCGMGFMQPLTDRAGFALLTFAEVERCMRMGPGFVQAEVLEVCSVTGKRSDYRERLRREEPAGDGSRPVLNMLLMKKARDSDRLMMPTMAPTLAQAGTVLAQQDSDLQLQQWRGTFDAAAPDWLQQTTDVGLSFSCYEPDGRARRQSVLISRVAATRDGKKDWFRVYDPATGEASSLVGASDLRSAAEQYVRMRTHGHVDSAALDFIDLFRLQSA